MKNKIKIGIIVFLMIVFGYSIVSNAAISTESKEVKSGEQFTIQVTSDVSLASYSVKVESDSGLTFVTSKGGTGEGTTSVSNALATGGVTNLATFTFKAPDVTQDTKYTVKFIATGMGDENLQTVANSDSTATITVKAPDVQTQEPENNTSSEPEKPTVTEPTKSNDATLKMLGLGKSSKNPSKYDFSGFKASKLTYDVTVPYDVKSLEVYYTVNNSKATCSISGNDNFEIGRNEINAKVTAEDGTQKTYTINVTREEEEKLSGDATLSNLGIGKSAKEPSEYDFTGFTKNTYEYSITVPNEVTSLDVYYSLSKSSSIADVSGSSNFKIGKNQIKILVTAEDGTQKTYTINVTRQAQNAVTTEPGDDEENSSQENVDSKLKLEKLEISKGKLSPEFNGSVTDYSLTVGSSVEKIDITAIANDENATIEIAGNEDLKEGKNIITILVRNSDDSEIVTYQIDVTKKSGIDIVGFFTNKENQNILIILGIILILIIIVIILLVRETKKENEDEFKPKKVKAKRVKDDKQDDEMSSYDEENTDSVNKE